MQITVYRTAEGFDALADEWDPLVRASRANYIFLTHAWQKTWWTHLHEGELCLVSARAPDGRLLGIAPLFLTTEEGHRMFKTVGCVDVSDYLEWIVATGHEAPVYEALLEALLTHPDVPTWDCLCLCNVPQESVSLAVLPDLARRRGLTVEIELEDVCPVLSLPTTWEAYLAALPRKQRHELRRKLRRAAELDWYQVGPEHDLGAEVDRFIALMRKSHPDKAEFILDRRHQAFFHAIAQATHQAGWLQLAFLTDLERPVATYFNFLYDGQVLVYNSGFDPAYGRLSPGIVLMAHLIRDAIEQGYRTVDFLRGNEGYKYDLGGVDTTVHRLLIHRPPQVRR
ncbi:MAG: GNAT family N-acetyltransferase [Chloroflexi bacterium]|nr:MAG: GNAT family N-acetyltransferase [Chloroflexota bacterium]